MSKGLWWNPENQRLSLKLTSVCVPAPLLLLFCLLLPAMPVSAQGSGPELTRALIDQRIATLRKEGVADSDEPLKTYRAIDLWLTSTELHKSDAARYIKELTDAPRREAAIQGRLDAMQSVQGDNEDLDKLSVQDLEADRKSVV